MARELISPTTSAVTTKAAYSVVKPPVFVFADALVLAETCTFYVSKDHGANWVALAMKEGGATTGAITLTATRMGIVIDFPCYLGVTKAATASACGVYVSDDVDL